MAKRKDRSTRIGEPGEVAQANLYLMKCGYVTGQILKVDGGDELA